MLKKLLTRLLSLLNPPAPKNYTDLIAHLHKGNHAKAIEDYEAALRIDPNDDGVKRNIEIVRKEM